MREITIQSQSGATINLRCEKDGHAVRYISEIPKAEMKKFRVYRSIRVENIEDVNMDSVGISWAVGESEAADFSEQFGEDYIVVSAIVSEDQIDIAQTNAQWNSDEHASEGEVVLKEFEDITVQFEGVEYKGNTYAANDSDETRPNAEECENEEVTNYMEEA